jgi:uncharacterized membrane-anchored protein
MTKKTVSTLARPTQNPIFAIAFGGMLAVAFCPRGYAQDASELSRIAWEHGPAVAQVSEQATMNLPEGFVFTHAAGAQKFLELTQNPPSGGELGIFAPEDLSWFAILSFSDVGYVRDDEKDSLDADAMLVSIQQGTEEGNKERRRRGWSTISVIGWMQSPHYDSSTRNLEWSLKGRDEEGQVVVNHFTRLLGRRGVMTVDFVAGMDSFQTQIVAFRQAMRGFTYTRGNDYLAFVTGDKVAEYGLTGLVVGGAAAAAAEAGLFKYLWKLIVAAVAGVGALLKKLFSPRRDERTAQYR